MDSNLKNTFTRLFTLTEDNDTFLISCKNKILFNGNCYQREGSDWKYVLVNDKQDYIGFVEIDQYEVLKRQIEELKHQNEELMMKNSELNQALEKNIKKKKRKPSKLSGQKMMIEKVMINISQMKKFRYDAIENSTKKSVKWIDDNEERINKLAEIYKLMSSSKILSEKYKQLKLLSLYNILYEEELDETNNTDSGFSEFQKDMKSALGIEKWSDAKILKKIELFTKLFSILPLGSWSICSIPMTYWNLIYDEYWNIIIDCTEKNKKFPFEEITLAEDLSNLSINVNEGEIEDELGSEEE